MFVYWLLVAFGLLIALGLSWAITCGLVYLITLCFGWTFTWAIGSGVWLIGLLLSGIFKTVVQK